MLLVIDHRSKVAIYEQIKNQILELITVGALPPHTQLPSIRALASDLGLNFNTVKKAFGDLENAGVIYTLPGRGCFVAENARHSDEIRQKAAEELHNGAIAARAAGISLDAAVQMLTDVYEPQQTDDGKAGETP